MVLPHGAVSWSVVCDCGISFVTTWSQQAGYTDSATFSGLLCLDL